MSKRTSLACVLLAFGLLLQTTTAHAQVLYGSIVGTVTDQSGAVVPNATVTISSRGTGQTRETVTDEAGRYSLVNVLPGTYELKVSASGFKPVVQTDVAVTINTVTRSDVNMQVGQVVETIVVQATGAVLQTDTADVRAELGSKAVTDLPLPRYRNYQSLMNLVPGATPGRFQNAITDTPARALTTNVNGANRNNNNTRIDGSTSVFIWLPHHTAYVPPAETIETVNISTNNFDAEQGMAGGAAVTVSTKSGTNDFHGSAFAMHENQRLRARNYFAPSKPVTIRNVDGFTLGGPIRRNKLFFFGGWEGAREREGYTGANSRSTVPTEGLRRGDFNGTGTTIYDPLTGDAAGRGRTAFANNTIPTQRLSAIALKMQELIPRPNAAGFFSNYFSTATSALNRDNFDVKVNWARTDKHQVWGKWSLMDAQVLGQFALGAAGGPCLCSGGVGVGNTVVNVATLGHTYTWSPTFLLDTTLGFTRMGQFVKGSDFGTNFGLETLGIPGTNGPDERQSGMPIFNLDGYTDLGNIYNWEPAYRNDQSWTFTQNATLIRGAHDLRFGFDAIHHHLNHWQPEVGAGPRGRLNFGGGVTALSGGSSPNQFNSYATFLLGLTSSVEKSVQFIKLTGLEWQFAAYVRDRWRVTPKLTLTLGVRWEYYPLLTRAQSGMDRYDAETNLYYIGGFGNVPRNVGITTSKRLFAPRVGFAYRMTQSTVIRSGYGITYNPMPQARPLRGFYPYTIASDFTGPNSFTPFGTLAQGIPEICCPDLSSGIVAVPRTAVIRTPMAAPLNRGYIQSWNFIIERRLPGDFVTSIGYVGSKTVHGFNTWNQNAGQVIGAGNAGRPAFARHGRTADTNVWQGWTGANYHSLQLAMNRHLSKGLMLKGAYTWSKAINMVDDDGTDGVGWNIPSMWRRNRALAGYDIPHMLQLGYLYELPFGRNRRWFADGAAAAILGDWQINGVFSSYQGRPFTVGASGASLNTPGNTQTADQVKSEVNKLGGIFDTPFYDPAAFAPVRDVRFGSSGRNLLRGPGAVNLDLSVFRKFRLTERFGLEFRAESFNLTNTPHFSNPPADASNAVSFFRINSTDENAPERQLRFGLRLNF